MLDARMYVHYTSKFPNTTIASDTSNTPIPPPCLSFSLSPMKEIIMECKGRGKYSQCISRDREDRGAANPAEGRAIGSAHRRGTLGAQGSAVNGPIHLAYGEARHGPEGAASSYDLTLGRSKQTRQITTGGGEPPRGQG